jgi:hypothetical protein
MLGARSIGRRLAAAAAGVLVLAPVAAAKSHPVYITAELSEQYYAALPGDAHQASVSEVSAYYRTTSNALSSGNGNLQIQPSAVLGSFSAGAVDPVPGAPERCGWHGTTGGGFQIAALQDGTPFRGELAIQWPDYPGMWDQRLNAKSTGNCPPTFQSNPLEGNLRWWLEDTFHLGGPPNRFIYLGVPRDKEVELHDMSGAAATFRMRSFQAYSGGQTYRVSAEGFLDESTLPFFDHQTTMPEAILPKTESPPNLLSAAALRRDALKALPKGIPRGCIVGQKRKRHQRCP